MNTQSFDQKLKEVRYALEMAEEHRRDCDSHHASRAIEYLGDALGALTDLVERLGKASLAR